MEKNLIRQYKSEVARCYNIMSFEGDEMVLAIKKTKELIIVLVVYTFIIKM